MVRVAKNTRLVLRVNKELYLNRLHMEMTTLWDPFLDSCFKEYTFPTASKEFTASRQFSTAGIMANWAERVEFSSGHRSKGWESNAGDGGQLDFRARLTT